jgi:hypothetical protein
MNAHGPFGSSETPSSFSIATLHPLIAAMHDDLPSHDKKCQRI